MLFGMEQEYVTSVNKSRKFNITSNYLFSIQLSLIIIVISLSPVLPFELYCHMAAPCAIGSFLKSSLSLSSRKFPHAHLHRFRSSSTHITTSSIKSKFSSVRDRVGALGLGFAYQAPTNHRLSLPNFLTMTSVMDDAPRRSLRRKSTHKEKVINDEKEIVSEKGPKKKPKKGTKKSTKRQASVSPPSSDDKTSTKKGKKPKLEPQRITDRDDLKKLWDDKRASKEDGSYTFKIMSWNVAGLRALLKNHPDALPSLATTHDLDVICLQETKLQEIHVTDPKLKIQGFLLDKEGYDSHYSCSTTKKGYSGTAVFLKRRSKVKNGTEDSGKDAPPKTKTQATLTNFFNTSSSKGSISEATKDMKDTTILNFDSSDLIPINVSKSIGKGEHDSEGRIICIDFPLFSLANVYVPNSGQKLERLSYRTDEWDSDLVNFMETKQNERQVPVMWLGDLNVAHTNLDVWNDGAKHLLKQAGTTPEERASFQRQLDMNNGSFVDAFRFLHPDAKGQYTYWSQRAGNRQPNKGLRLDYFICGKEMMNEDGKVIVRDSYMIPDQLGSDHCPIILELEIRK